MPNSDGKLCSVDGDGGELLYGGLDDDRGVGEEVDAVLHDHQVDAANAATFLSADDLQRRPNHLRIVVGDAGETDVGVALGHHHGAEVVGLAEQVVGEAERDALALAAFVERLRVRDALSGDEFGSMTSGS